MKATVAAVIPTSGAYVAAVKQSAFNLTAGEIELVANIETAVAPTMETKAIRTMTT